MFRSMKLLVAGLSLTTLAFATPVTFAAPATQPAEHGAAGGRRNPGEMLEKEMDKLNLTDDQKKQITPIIEKLKDTVKSLIADKTLDKDARRDKVKDAMTSARTDIEAILTPDQKAQLKKDMEERRANAGGGGKKGDKGGDKAPPAPAPAN